VRQLRRRSGGQRSHDLAFQVGPGESFGFNPDAGILGLEAAGDIVEGLDRLRLGLGVPDAHDLVLREPRGADGDNQSGRKRGNPRQMHDFLP